MPTDYTRTVIESKNKTNVIVSLSVASSWRVNMSTVCFCPQEEEEMSAVLVLMFLFAVSGDSLGAVTDCSGSTMETNSAVRLLSSVVDTQRAEQSRREHLEALFNRWAPGSETGGAGPAAGLLVSSWSHRSSVCVLAAQVAAGLTYMRHV